MEKNQSQTDRVNFNATGGFRSDRNHYKNDTDRSMAGDSTDRSNKEKNDAANGINFFFYKNFNKFIQNLYIQDEQLIKKKTANEKRESDKFSTNNSASKKDIESSYSKKTQPQPMKKPGTAAPTISSSTQNTQRNNNTSSTITSLKPETTKKFIVLDDEKKYYYKPKEEIYNNYVKDSGSKMSKTLNKSGSKNSYLDYSRNKYDQPEIKSFLTPREYKY